MPAREADEPPADRRLTGSTGRRVLVCATARPPVGTGRSVDVRPGAAATFDGDRVRLPITVSAGDRRTRVAWIDLSGLDAVVSSMLEPDAASAVRFGDRAACRRLLGRATTAAIERRLAATAGAAEAALVTWTHRPRRGLDGRPYDVVVEGTNRSD